MVDDAENASCAREFVQKKYYMPTTWMMAVLAVWRERVSATGAPK
jgi:hypothetical protein